MRIFGLYRKCPAAVCAVLVIALGLTSSLALGASQESEGAGVVVIPDESVVIQIINFILTIWILNLILYRPLRNILRQRKEKIEGLELSIETYNEDSTEKDDAFASGIKAAKEKGLKEKEDLLHAAAEEEKKIIENVNKTAKAELAEIREKIAIDVQAAKEELQEKVDEFASDICQKILGRTIS